MHMDMDCFYAQVERERFPEWANFPVAVVQNGTLCVATNYAVRLRGSKKIGQAGLLHHLLPETKFAGRYVRVQVYFIINNLVLKATLQSL